MTYTKPQNEYLDPTYRSLGNYIKPKYYIVMIINSYSKNSKTYYIQLNSYNVYYIPGIDDLVFTLRSARC